MPTVLVERGKGRESRASVQHEDPAPRPAGPAGSGRRRARLLERMLLYRPAAYAAFLIILVAVVSLLAPLFTPYGRDAIDLDEILSPPSPAHILGTDELGRDVFTRIIYGGRFTLLVAFASVAVATGFGLLLGTAAGFFGGIWERLVTGAVDLFMSIPVFLVLLVVASLGKGVIWLIPLVIGMTSWMETARVTRAGVLALKREGFIEAARSLGTRDSGLIWKHMLPHALPPVIVASTVGFAHAMLVESALSFLGFGIQPPAPTWGNMLQNAQVFLRSSPIVAVAPGAMIFVTCLSFNFLGDGLRKALADEPQSC
jgi:peptide/nickel transport system permease protein